MVTQVAQMELVVFVVTAELFEQDSVHTRKEENTLYKSLYSINLGKNDRMTYLHDVSLELTCTCLHAVRPSMISVTVAGTSAALVPGTTWSATTNLAGFLEGAALETRHHAPNHRGDESRAD